MGVSIKKLETLVDNVVLPFEKFIMNDARLAEYLADPEVAKVHNLAVAKLTIYMYADIKRAYAYIQEGAKAHKEKHIPLSRLKEFYSLYFVLCKEWNENHFERENRFGTNLETIEQFAYEAFAQENEAKDDFYIYDSEALTQDLAKMHYADEAKISAEDFCAEGSIDELDIQDILECCNELYEGVQDYNIEHNQDYFTSINEKIRSYAAILEKNLEFRDLGFSLSKLSQLLEEHITTLATHSNKKKILMILRAITEDLISWTEAVLREKTTIDIHYLDASLLSSIVQFEMILVPPVDEEDSLEFF